MKKFTILLMMTFCLSVSWTFAQQHEIQRGKMNPPRVDFLNLSPGSPAYWAQDSTWYFRWETSTLSWSKYEREIHLRDGQGNQISSTYLDWNQTLSEWVPGTRYYFEYYNDSRTKKSYRQYWNRVGSFWVDLDHTFYDTEGRVTETQQQSYNYLTNEITAGTQTLVTYTPLTVERLTRTLVISTMSWINTSRSIENYDADKMISQIRQTWNTATSVWTNVAKGEITYNASGDPTEELSYTWNEITSIWEKDYRITYGYNSTGLEINTYQYSWNSSISGWDNQNRTLSQYDTDGRMTQWLFESWNILTMDWVSFMKSRYTYFPNGNTQEYFGYEWNPLLSSFREVNYALYDTIGDQLEYISKQLDYTTYEYTSGYRQLSTFDGYRILVNLSQNLNILTNGWVDYQRRIWTYDANLLNVQEQDEEYTTGTGIWSPTFRQQHFYSDFIGVNDKPGVKDYCYFSNPLQAGKTINCPDLKEGSDYQINLINMRGQRVFSLNLKAGGSFSVPSTIQAGTYVLQILEAGKAPVTGKVIVLN